MSLPKIQMPIVNITIPSTKIKKRFRPFLVREEKILLLAQEGSDSDLLDAISQIINNCCLEEIDVNSLASFDLEYIFLKLRARSVNNMVELKYRDKEDEKIYTFNVDLDTIEVSFDSNHTNKIKVTDDLSLLMKYPSVDIANKAKNITSEDDLFYLMIVNSLDKLYSENEVFIMSEYTFDEAKEFIDGLTIPVFEKIQEFFETMPKLQHVLEYTNSLGSKRVIELQGIKDFFM
jgi:hypothetical protein